LLLGVRSRRLYQAPPLVVTALASPVLAAPAGARYSAGQPGRSVMRKRALLLSLVVLLVVPVGVRAQSSAAPETVGMSKERLARIGQALNGQIEAKSFPGAVVLVARKGRVAYFEAFGQLDPKTGSPMARDAIFRLYSMTKPFTSVAAMML